MTAWKALCIRACGWKPFEGVRTEDLDYAIVAIRRKPAAPGVPEGLCVILTWRERTVIRSVAPSNTTAARPRRVHFRSATRRATDLFPPRRSTGRGPEESAACADAG